MTQVFQNLAYCLKKKMPGLKRNLKFDDREMTLIMNVTIGEEWKTIQYQAAKNLLKKKTPRSNSISRTELKSILNNSDVVNSEESMEEGDDTVVFEPSTNNKHS